MASITTDQVKKIATLSRSAGRQMLASFLYWKHFNDETDTRSSIILDYLYDNLMFAVKKGFPWAQACLVLKMSSEIHQESIGKPLPDAVKIYKEKAMLYGGTFGERNLNIFSEHFFLTFMRHYKLFQYVFTQDQERNIPCYELEVGVPVPPECLKNGTPIHIWDYQEKIKELEKQEEHRKNELLQEKHKTEETVKAKLKQSTDRYPDTKDTLQKEVILDIIKDAISDHVSVVSNELTNTIKEHLDDLEFKLEKTVLPRPTALGQPPRFNTKTPIQKSTPRESKERKKSGKSAGKKK